MLILAGVSISMLVGQNGILTQTQNAKSASKIADIKEKAKTDILNLTYTSKNEALFLYKFYHKKGASFLSGTKVTIFQTTNPRF